MKKEGTKKAFQLDYDIANAMIEQIDEVVHTKIISLQFEDVAKQLINVNYLIMM